MTLIIDPPSGWMYGFPKEIPIEVFNDNDELKTWFLAQGYPENLIDVAMIHTRYWYEE